ncbi:MAG: tripartite tricarboxylate transporter TctB family protein [Planctomycetota bacterium]|jgi:hypothetical protein|nr:tripartite tricarboxylate transporter TctB family protein [Planctomycetota bacterium]
MSKTRKEMCFGLGMFLSGLAYFICATQLPRKSGIDSATVPCFLSSLIMLLGIVHLAANWRRRRGETASRGAVPAAEGVELRRRDFGTVALTAILIVAYVSLLAPFGFPLMSSIYLFLQMSLLTPGYEKRRFIPYTAISVTVPVVVYYSFLWAFDLMLPSGDVWYDMGWV